MNKQEYFKMFIDYMSQQNYNGKPLIEIETYDVNKAENIFPPKIIDILFNQEDYLDALPLLINSGSVWIKHTALFCLQNPHHENLLTNKTK